MKRLLLALVLIAAVVLPVSALSLTFQNYGDTTDTACPYDWGGPCTWVESSTGGNNYIHVPHDASLRNKDPVSFTYWSADLQYYWVPGYGYGGVTLYDSSFNTLYTYSKNGYSSGWMHWEVKMIGGKANVYENGVLLGTSGTLAVNPSYIAVASGEYTGANLPAEDVDNWQMGSSGQYLVGMPETNSGGAYYFLIKKDVSNPADSGLANGATWVTVSTYNMSTTFSKPTNATETMSLRQTATGYVVATATVSGYTGTVNWPLQEAIFNNANANYGSFVAYLSGDTSSISTPIQYVSTGAYVWFNQHLYSRDDPYTVYWTVDSTHWDPSTYSYNLRVFDVYGTDVVNTPVTTQTSAYSNTWGGSIDTGAYYAALIETDSTGTQYWLNYDACTVMGNVIFNGTVYDGYTQLPISGANVSICQGSVCYNKVTTALGNYSTDSTTFVTGASTSLNVTRPLGGYYQYRVNITPPAEKRVQLDFMLEPVAPSTTGLALQGGVRDGLYGRLIPYATVIISNASYAENYSVTANGRAYYLADESNGIYFTNGRWYSVTGHQTGYEDSTYFKQVVSA